MSYSKGIGGAIGEGTSAFVQQFIGRQDQVKQQGEALAQQDTENAFRQQQADEAKRQFELQFKYRRDSEAYGRLETQRQEVQKLLSSGAFEKDPLLKGRAVNILQQNGKLLSVIGKGGEPVGEDLTAYDTLYGDFAEVTGLGAAVLGRNAATRDDAATKVVVNQAAMSDYDMVYARDTLPQKIAGFNATQDITILNGQILASLAPFQTAAGKAQALATIAALGSVARGAVEGLLASGDIDPDTVAAARTRMAQVDTINNSTAVVAQGEADQVPFRVDATRYQAGLLRNQLYVSDNTKDGQVDTINNAAEQSGVNLKLSELELAKVQATFDSTVTVINDKNDFDSANIAVQKGLLKLTSAAAQSKYLSDIAASGGIGAEVVNQLVSSGDLDPDVAAAVVVKANRVDTTEGLQLNILEDQAAITDLDRQKGEATFQTSLDLFNSDADLRIKTNEAAVSLVTLKTAGEKAAYLQSIAKLGTAGQAILDGLKDRGIITAQQAAGFKQTAGNAQTVDDAAAKGATLSNDVTEFSLTRAKALFPVELKSAQTALDMANEQLAAFKEGRPVNLATLKANLATINQALDQNGQLFGSRLDAARLQVKQLESELRVAQGTEAARITTAEAGADTATATATSAGVQAQLDVATLPDQIKARQVTVQQAQAALAAQLTENRFADATFAARVKAIDLNNSTSVEQLLALKQRYQQDAKKFPKELQYLDGQIALMQANVKEAAAKLLTADGTTVSDKKSMGQALTRMQIGVAAELRFAQSNYKSVVDKLFPNARFAVDKYNPTNFSTLVRNRSDLTPEQQAELQTAATQLDAARGMSKDLVTALGQVGAKGRIDPKVAERLGIYAPGEGQADSSTYIGGPAPVVKGAAIARNVQPGVVTGNGGVVFQGGGAQAVQSLLPQGEISKQIAMTTDHYLGKIKQQKGNGNPWDNAAGPVRAYNGLEPTAENQIRYVNDIRATYNAKPWIQAINDATGARKTELAFINSEADRIAKQRGVDPDVIKALMWNESMGWQPGIPSSDGKGGGLGQVTGYFPPKGSSYSSTTRGATAPPQTVNPLKAPTPPGPAAQPNSKPTTPSALPPLGSAKLDSASIGILKTATQDIMKITDPAKQKAEGVRISANLAAMLSTKYGVKITPQQVATWIQQNGRGL